MNRNTDFWAFLIGMIVGLLVALTIYFFLTLLPPERPEISWGEHEYNLTKITIDPRYSQEVTLHCTGENTSVFIDIPMDEFSSVPVLLAEIKSRLEGSDK